MNILRLLVLAGILVGYWYLCRATARAAGRAGRDPSMWLIYAVFVPGISYLHARQLKPISDP